MNIKQGTYMIQTLPQNEANTYLQELVEYVIACEKITKRLLVW